MRIAILGTGRFGMTLLSRLLAAGFPADRLCATHRRADARAQLAARFPVLILADNATACTRSDIFIIGVRPQQMRGLLAELVPCLRAKHVVVSVAAALTLPWLRQCIGPEITLYRLMPPPTVGVGAGTVLLSTDAPPDDSRRMAIDHLARQLTGDIAWVDDTQLELLTYTANAVTPLLSALLTQLTRWISAQGVSLVQAEALVLRAVSATSRQFEHDQCVSAVTAHAATPGGMTNAALAALERDEVLVRFLRAPQAMLDRAREIREGSD